MVRKMGVSSAATAVLQCVLILFVFVGDRCTAFRVGYPSCKAVLTSYPSATSGDYTLTTSTGRTLPKAYCEMGLNGGGYTFLHPSDVKSMTNEEVQAMSTDKMSVLLRVRLTNGSQPYGVLKQLSADMRSPPVAVFLNSNPGYASPQNSAVLGGNYLYFGFQPRPITAGTTQGLEVNGVPLSFVNGDGNPNGYFALFPDNAESIPSGYSMNAITWPLYTSILSALRQNPSTRVIPDDYFMFFEGHFGGSGMYVQADREQARYPQRDLAGNRNVFVISMAIGFR